MRVLVVLAHPLQGSFAASVAREVMDTLASKGHQAELLDLYADDFDPRLTADERSRVLDSAYDSTTVAPYAAALKQAEALILVFPQWWFNLPAILKGYIDRVFVPGVAYDLDGGRLVPGLPDIKHFWVFTSTGSPWWVVHFYMGNPVRRLLKRGVAAFCAKGLDFRMLTLHDMDHCTQSKRTAFLAKIRKTVERL